MEPILILKSNMCHNGVSYIAWLQAVVVAWLQAVVVHLVSGSKMRT